MALLEVVARKKIGGGRIGLKIEDQDGNPARISEGMTLRGNLGETYRVAKPKPEDGVWIVLVDAATGKTASPSRYLEIEE
jgi:hypothetical protein